MAKLTVDQVKAEVARIRAMQFDDEAAHAAEDDLHLNVLTAIATGDCDDPQACALEALETVKIDFARWCA